MVELSPRHVSTSSSINPSSQQSVREKAAEFEGMLLAQVLQKLSDCYRNPDGEGTDSAGESFLNLANSALGGGLARSGGIGLGELLAKSLTRDNQSLESRTGCADVNSMPF